MSRSTIATYERVPFFVHVDEFQSFGTDAFASLMSEARKYGAHFCLSHQFTDKITPHVRAAVLGEIEAKRKAFIRKWRLKCRAVADSLEEAGDRLFTFTRFPKR